MVPEVLSFDEELEDLPLQLAHDGGAFSSVGGA